MGETISIYLSFILYLIFMLAIGGYFYGRTKDLSDYVLGGRRLNSWVCSLSAQASDMSGWLLMGLPGAAYLVGLESAWIAIGLAVGTWLNWQFVAARLREYTEVSGDSITLPDFFESRFRDKTHLLRIVSALFIVIFFLIYTASGFVAGAKLFSSVFGLSYHTALYIGASIIVAYTFLGGFLAVSYTDFVQGMLMLVAIVFVPVAALYSLGGVESASNILHAVNVELTSFRTTVTGEPLSWMAIVSSLAWGLGYFGQPHILARFMGIESTRFVSRARVIAMVWVIISLSCAVAVGLVARAYLLDAPLVAGSEETVFVVMVHALMPTVLVGVFMAAILAAIMSTADSQLLVASSSLTRDFYQILLFRYAGKEHLVWVSRLGVAIVSVVAVGIASNPDSSVLELVSYAWAGLGATFGPVLLLSLYWPRMTRWGALAGLLVGGVTVIVWKHLSGGIFDLYEIVPGIVSSLTSILVVSLIDKPPSEDILDEFDRV